MPLIHVAELPVKEIVPGYKAQFIHTGTNTFSYLQVTAGSKLGLHHHPHQQIAHVCMDFYICHGNWLCG